MKTIILIIFFSCLTFSYPPVATSGVTESTIEVSWDDPTKNCDESNLTDLAGFEICWSITSEDIFTKCVDIGKVNTYKIEGLPANTKHYVVVEAYDLSGNSSKECATEMPNIIEVWTLPDTAGPAHPSCRL